MDYDDGENTQGYVEFRCMGFNKDILNYPNLEGP